MLINDWRTNFNFSNNKYISRNAVTNTKINRKINNLLNDAQNLFHNYQSKNKKCGYYTLAKNNNTINNGTSTNCVTYNITDANKFTVDEFKDINKFNTIFHSKKKSKILSFSTNKTSLKRSEKSTEKDNLDNNFSKTLNKTRAKIESYNIIYKKDRYEDNTRINTEGNEYDEKKKIERMNRLLQMSHKCNHTKTFINKRFNTNIINDDNNYCYAKLNSKSKNKKVVYINKEENSIKNVVDEINDLSIEKIKNLKLQKNKYNKQIDDSTSNTNNIIKNSDYIRIIDEENKTKNNNNNVNENNNNNIILDIKNESTIKDKSVSDKSFSNYLDGNASFFEKKKEHNNNQINYFLSPRATKECEHIFDDIPEQMNAKKIRTKNKIINDCKNFINKNKMKKIKNNYNNINNNLNIYNNIIKKNNNECINNNFCDIVNFKIYPSNNITIKADILQLIEKVSIHKKI